MDAIRERYDEYCEARERARLGIRGGAVDELDALDDRFGDVTGGDLAAELRAEAEPSAAASRLALALETAHLESRLRSLRRDVDARERALALRVGGARLPAPECARRVAFETDTERRRELQDAVDAASDELAEPRAECFARGAEVRAALGYTTGRQRAEALHPGVDFDAWAEAAGRLLEATEPAFRDLLEPALARARVAPGTAHRGDVQLVERASALDRQFPPRAFDACLSLATSGLGPLRGVKLERESDAEPRCFVIRPHAEVVVSLARRGGVWALRRGFAAVGRALHGAFTSPELPVERARFGDAALGTAWALLLAQRVADPRWIADSPASLRADELAAGTRLSTLIALRRIAALARFELALASLPAGDDPTPLAGRYADELEAALAARVHPAGYLVDAGAELRACDELRARCLEAQLAEHLRERFGHRFWRERRAGELLKELWNTGWTYSADELADQLGLGPLAIDAVVDVYALAR